MSYAELSTDQICAMEEQEVDARIALSPDFWILSDCLHVHVATWGTSIPSCGPSFIAIASGMHVSLQHVFT